MSITPGWTDQQIRDFVYEYEKQPYGTRSRWLAEQGVAQSQFRRWRNTIVDGNLEEGLVPRQAVTPLVERRVVLRREAAQQGEIEALRTQVRELKEVNEALGKAIGLLHKLSEQEPTTPATNEPNSSSPLRTSS